VIRRSKMWQSSNIQARHRQVKLPDWRNRSRFTLQVHLPNFRPQPFVFLPVIYRHMHYITQNHNFAYCLCMGVVYGLCLGGKNIVWGDVCAQDGGRNRTWRKVHIEKLRDLHSSSNTMRLIKLRRMKWAGHGACTRETRNTHSEFWLGKI